MHSIYAKIDQSIREAERPDYAGCKSMEDKLAAMADRVEALHAASKAKLTAEERDELVDYALADLIREVGHHASEEATEAFLADLAMREAADAISH